MGKSLTHKILEKHLVEGQLVPGKEIAIKIDQTLTQDATGTMAFLQFEAMGVPRVKTELSVNYVDHNMLQTSFENADDHRFLKGITAKHGVYFSRPGNGICHQVQLERFSVPGTTLLGADSHTTNSGGIGALAIGAGGLDIAVAMAGEPYFLAMPKVVQVKLTGHLQPWVSAKDVILELLKRLTVKGGVGKIFEYTGPGVATLTVPQRATITNVGAELGATTSIFPSDAQTKRYLRAQNREDAWKPLAADRDAKYDEVVEVNLDTLEPMIACPSSPDNVKRVKEVAGTPIAQVCVGSCSNSSFMDLTAFATALKGKHVHPNVTLTVTPGTRQAYSMIAKSGALKDMIDAGARILESGCGPCIGMGQAPPTDGATVRTFNRNFPGRSGTPGDKSYLASPEVAAACALAGKIADPRDLGPAPQVKMPTRFIVDDGMVIPPAKPSENVEIIRGPNIKPLPAASPMSDTIKGSVLLKVGDNITTDHISPAGAKALPLRSNIPAISEFTFESIDPTFAKRAKEKKGGVIVGGVNYGQGSSREHAALQPMYLGVKAVLVKSIARIHWSNLVNFGILPLTFKNEQDYNRIDQGDELEMVDVKKSLAAAAPIAVRNVTKGTTFQATYNLSPRQIELLEAGGLLNFIKQRAGS